MPMGRRRTSRPRWPVSSDTGRCSSPTTRARPSTRAERISFRCFFRTPAAVQEWRAAAGRGVAPRLATHHHGYCSLGTSVSDPEPIGELEQQIGVHVANLIEDGARLQLGIGGVPNAVYGVV